MDKPPSFEGPGTKIGHYELLELIGEGGMGLVYLAQQTEPVRRKVVLKIVKPGMDSKQVIARFEAERQVLAILDHPNIAHVFDAGTTEIGRPYFVMEYVKGMSITRYCDEKKLNIEQRLRLFEQVCEGIHHAHQKGIIHRDIKPSNVLVSVHGDKAVPKIIDFGIAKAVTSPLTDKTFVTFQGQLLGTPEYMSPEQVDLATQDIDTRSDIYSLGVVLYELLTGVLPFEEDSFGRRGFAEIQRTIREVEPASPSMRLTNLGEQAKTIAATRGTQVVPLARRLHRELEWIPLKAMRKDRCRRYRSASEMADDIHNYLTGRLLIAGPETVSYRVQKFVQKHAGSVATVALVTAAVIIGLIVSTTMYFQAEQAKESEQEQRKLAEDKAEELRRSLYVNNIQLADAKYREGNASEVQSLLDACPEDLRGWEWNRLNFIQDESIMTIHTNHNILYAAVLSPNGKNIITGGDDETIKVWNFVTDKSLTTLRGRQGAIDSLAVSSDGSYVASIESEDRKTIHVWSTQSGNEAMMLKGHKDRIRSVAFSPDGRLIASGGNDKTIKLWDAKTGTELRTFNGYNDSITAVAFSPDSKYIVSSTYNETLNIWDITTGVNLITIPGVTVQLISCWCVAFSPDSKRIISGSMDGSIKVWDAKTGQRLMTIRGHNGTVSTVTFSPDGQLIASGGYDNMVRIWDAETGEELRTFEGHNWVVVYLAFSPDDKQLISASLDDTVKKWDVLTDRKSTRIHGHNSSTFSVAFSPDGRQIASASLDSAVKLWDAETSETVKTMRAHSHFPWSVAFSPDGKHIVSSGRDQREIRVWNALTGSQVMTLRGHKAGIRSVAFSPNGKYIISGSDDETIKVWDSGSGTELKTLHGHEDCVFSVAFSPDDKRIVSGSRDKTIRVWDSTNGAELMTLRGHTGQVYDVTFSPDGKLIASADQDHTAKIWDAETGVEQFTLHGHRDFLTSVVFSPDGKRLVTASRDGTVRIWNSKTGAELLTLHADSCIYDVAFSPDGKTIVGGTAEGSVVFWESAPPAGGYELLRNAEEARRLVERLYRKYGFYHDLISQLQSDATIEPSFRKIALQTANTHKWEDADKLKNEARNIVISADKNIEEYRIALAKSEKANGWEPNDPAVLTTLGAAQYRLGSYEDATRLLTRSARILAAANEDQDPVNIAFTGMILQRTGHIKDAKAALETLRELCRQEENLFWDMEVQGLLAEAEKLIAGEEK